MYEIETEKQKDILQQIVSPMLFLLDLHSYEKTLNLTSIFISFQVAYM